MNRRSFLTGMLATCTAPAIVRADSLMKMRAIGERDPALVIVAPSDIRWTMPGGDYPDGYFAKEYAWWDENYVYSISNGVLTKHKR